MISDIEKVIEFVKTIPKNVFQKSCLNVMESNQMEEINKTLPLLKSDLIVYSVMQQCFLTTSLTLIPNLLVSGDQYLVLSNCKIIKLQSQTKLPNSIFGIQLQNVHGNLLIFFKFKQQYQDWIKQLKLFCKLSNFVTKFSLFEQIIKDYYLVQHKKSKKCYTAYVYTIKNNSTLDILNSEIQTLRSIKHSSLLDLRWVYEDTNYIYLIYEQFKCEKLIELLNQGLVLDQTQLASIALQLLQALKFLNKNSIYHGNITPSNILINTQSTYLQVFLINMTYISNIEKEPIQQYLKYVSDWFIAPEIKQKFVKPSINTDLYQIGLVLYYLTFFTYSKRKADKLEQVNFDLIDQAEVSLQQINRTQQKYRMLYTVSQLDLIRRLLDKSENRIKLEVALKHHWFINIKQKLKPRVERRKQHLPSLKTIIELCEQRETTKKIDFLQCQNAVEDESVLEENNQIELLMENLEKIQSYKRPSKENHEKLRMYEQFKTQIEFEKTATDKQFIVSKSIV